MEEALRRSIHLVLNAIPQEEPRQILAELLQIALPSLHKLSTLDDNIFQCYAACSTVDEESGALDLMVTALRNDIFAGPQRFVKRQFELGFIAEDLPQESGWDSGEFDFGDFGDFGSAENYQAQPASGETFRGWVSASRSSRELPHMGDHDIDEAIDFLTDDEAVSSVQDVLDGLREDLTYMSRTLREQLLQEEDRLRQAFHEANYGLMIRELDASRTTLMEALFALVSAIFVRFLDDFDPTTLPGYRNALGHALIARSHVARLMYQTNTHNALIQDPDRGEEERREHLHALQSLLDNFIKGNAFQSLVPADRWEFVNFLKDLQRDSLRLAAQSAEGLSKYLESHHSLNQGEILQQYDQDIVDEIQSLLEASQSLIDISFINAKDLVNKAHEAACKLYGRRMDLDIQLDTWAYQPPSLETPNELRSFMEQLTKLIR